MKNRILGIIISLVLLLSFPCSFALAAEQGISTAAVSLSDMNNHWSKDAVYELLNKNAVPFIEDKFMPDNAVKRCEFAVMLHNALDIKIYYLVEPDIRDYYDDIDQNSSYSSAVIDLVTVGVFEGDGSFDPEGTMTREEMVHYIMQAYKYRLGDNYAMIKIGPATFYDIDEVAPQYSGEISLAQHYGLIKGTGNNEFEPKKVATRAEAAAIINTLSKLTDNSNLQVTVEPKAIVNDDSIEMKIIVKNNLKNEVSIINPSGQTFDFQLLDADKNVLYTWSANKMFIQIFTTTNIEAGGSLEYSDILSGEEYKAIKDKIVYMKAYLTGNASFINPEGYEIKVK